MSHQISLALGISEDDLLNCMQCGFCLSVCPTYKIIPKETATPRGRIALMKAVQDGGGGKEKELEVLRKKYRPYDME